MLTHKKPEPVAGKIKSTTLPKRRTKANSSKTKLAAEGDEEEREGEDEVLWAVGEVSDNEGEDEDEDVDHHQHPLYQQDESRHNAKDTERDKRRTSYNRRSGEGEELIGPARRSMDPFRDDNEVEMERLR